MTSERYKVIEPNFEDEFITDCQTDKQYNICCACELLNKQDKEINHQKWVIEKQKGYITALEKQAKYYKEKLQGDD